MTTLNLPNNQSSVTPENVQIDLSAVDEIVARIGTSPDTVIPILHEIQAHYRYLPQEALRRVCEITEITPTAISGVATFYAKFRHAPVGQHIISVCHGTACHVKGAPLVSEAMRRHLGLNEGEDTTPDGVFTLGRVDCVGCCTLAPVVQIDGITYGHVTPDTIGEIVEDFLALEDAGALGTEAFGAVSTDGLAEVRVGVGSCCIAGGSMGVLQALQDAIADISAPAVVKPVGCVGMCHQTPLVEIHIPGQKPAIYAKVQEDDARGIIRHHFKPKGFLCGLKAAMSDTIDRILTDEAWTPVSRYAIDTRDAPVCAFLGPQEHIATECYGETGPLDIEGYMASGGFEALRKVIDEMRPEEIINHIIASGLKGRGGAGFPTGLKWQIVHNADDPIKYAICNGDEGDPGAFMDRMLLESYPFRVLEGLAIAAYAVGARTGYLYIRAEYGLAVERVRAAIRECESRGLLGANIFGTDFSLSLQILEGAGAFVCGEETGLIASLEGRRGTPRLRPPYPAESGLRGKPTCVNNVETLALVPYILRKGFEEFGRYGTPQSKGTKVFSLTGKVQRGGLIEVPMGITIRQIVEDIGGGAAEGRKFKAVQIGGPSGGCIPASLADTPVDYEALTGAGAIMGSGGLVVMDDSDCMLDVARYFLEFTQRESCGKCTPCRVGTRRMLEILDRLCTGQGKTGDIEKLEELAQMVKQSSLCGLGQTAPNPVLTTIRYFREEYEEHIRGRCPAGKCKELIQYCVTDDCIGCTKCAQHCPTNAIALRPYEIHEIDPEKCVRCDTCRQLCPVDAIVIKQKCQN